MGLKTLRNNKIWVLNTAFPTAVIGIVFFYIGYFYLCADMLEEVKGILFSLILMDVTLVLAANLMSIGSYRRQWIQYGNGKVTVRRVSRLCLSGGMPLGNEEDREDTFRLEELEAYGLSGQCLDHQVEKSAHRARSGDLELFFQLKSGKKIGYDMRYCMRKDLDELFEYIYRGTGIKVAWSPDPRKEADKKVIKYLLWVMAAGIAFMLISLVIERTRDVVIEVDGFEVRYKLADRRLTYEDLKEIETGSSMAEISDKLGEPDTWIGSGILRPVYFVDERRVAVIYFRYPNALDDLMQIVLVDESGERQTMELKPDENEKKRHGAMISFL